MNISPKSEIQSAISLPISVLGIENRKNFEGVWFKDLNKSEMKRKTLGMRTVTLWQCLSCGSRTDEPELHALSKHAKV